MLLLVAIVAFVISAWNSWIELRYAVSGYTATADVTRAYRHSESGRRRSREFLRVEVTFPSDGQSRQAVLRAPLSARISSGQQVEIQYLPGSDRARLRGEHEFVWVAAFVCSTAWIGWSFVRLAREANQPVKRKRRRRPRPSLE
jgi:hypothetical protein